MKKIILKNKKIPVAIAACLVIGAITMSFQDTPFYYRVLEPSQALQDTFHKKNSNGSVKMKDLDRLQELLDQNMILVNEQLKKINLDAIQEVELSLKEIDMDKISKEVALSLKDINVDKIMADVRSSLKDINLSENSAATRPAMEEAKRSLEEAMTEIRNINTDEIKKEIAHARIDLEKSSEEVKKIDLNKIMAGAKEDIEKAKSEVKLIRTMLNEMEKDGLISRKDGFTIEYKNKDLYINGTKQNESVTAKYRNYFKEDHFKITVDKEENRQ